MDSQLDYSAERQKLYIVWALDIIAQAKNINVYILKESRKFCDDTTKIGANTSQG